MRRSTGTGGGEEAVESEPYAIALLALLALLACAVAAVAFTVVVVVTVDRSVGGRNGDDEASETGDGEGRGVREAGDGRGEEDG